MHKRWRAGFLGLALILATQARAQDPNADFTAYRTLFSVAALGEARGPAAVTGYTLHYRGTMPHAAFALAALPDGRSVWRFIAGQPDAATARARLQAACDRDAVAAFGAGRTCRVIATDGAVEALDRPAFRPVQASIGPFRAAPLMFRHGPQAAEGVVVWSHGYGGRMADHRERSAPGVLALLNDAGWDVLRFDRDPAEDDLPVALATMRRGLPLLDQAGYRRVVLAGQSRGGWQSVMLAAEQPEAIHAVLAFAPAAHGESARPNNLAAALEDFRRLLAGLPEAGPRIAITAFAGDPYDPDPAARAVMVGEAAARRSAPTLAVFPEPPIQGHSAVNDWRFTRAFGGCLLTLVQGATAAAPRGVRRNPCGGG